MQFAAPLRSRSIIQILTSKFKQTRTVTFLETNIYASGYIARQEV